MQCENLHGAQPTLDYPLQALLWAQPTHDDASVESLHHCLLPKFS